MPGRGKLLLELLKNSGTQQSQSTQKPGHHVKAARTAQAEGVSGTTSDSLTTGTSSSGSEREEKRPPLGAAPWQEECNVLDEDKLTEAIKAVNARQQKSDDDLACLENWNPMEDDFKCPDFNSYDNGPGKDLPLHIQRPVEGQKPKEERKNELYVTGIPLAMSEDGLKNLFSRAGKVVRVKKCQSKFKDRPDTFGFVQLSDTAGVENAVRMIDNLHVGECVMHVRIAMSKEDAEARRKKNEPLSYKLADEHEDNEDDDGLVIADDEMMDGEETNTTGAEPAAATGEVTNTTPAASLVEGIVGATPEVTPRPTPGASTIGMPPRAAAAAAAGSHSMQDVGVGQKEPTPVTTRPKQPAPVTAHPQVTAPVKLPQRKHIPKKPEPRPCMLCGIICSKQCSKCLGPYCGSKCQQEDWLKHKFICQKPVNKFEERFMIDDDEVADFMDEVVDQIRIDESALRRETLPVGKPIKVTLTDIRSPSDFSLIKTVNFGALEELKNKMNQKFIGQARDDDYHPLTGDVCAAPYQGDWYRARIDRVDRARGQAIVTFVDYGNTDTVAVSNLAKLPPSMVGMAAQAVSCSLDIEPVSGTWCEDSLQLLVESVYTEGQAMATVLLPRIDKTIVDMTKEGVNIADRFVSGGVAKKILVPSRAAAVPTRTDVSPSTRVTHSTSTHQGEGDAATAKPLSTKPTGSEPSPMTSTTESQPAPRTPPAPHSQPSPDSQTASQTLTGPNSYPAPQSQPAPQTPSTHSQTTPHTPPTQTQLHTSPLPQQSEQCPNKPPPMSYAPAGSHIGIDAEPVPRAATPRGGSTSPVQFQSYIKKHIVRAGDQLRVVVVHVESIDNFWVQYEDTGNDFATLQRELQKVYSTKKPKTGFRCPGHKLVAAYSPMYEAWFRCRVLDCDTAKVHVFCVDYGNEEWIDFAHIHSLDSPFCSVPEQAMPCRLESIIPRTNQTLACFKSYVDAARLECKVLGEVGGSYTVDLRNSKKPSSLRDILLNQATLSPGTQKPQTPPRSIPPQSSPSPTPVAAAASVTKSSSVISSPQGSHSNTPVMASSLTRSILPATTNVHRVIVNDATSYDNIIVSDVNNTEAYDTFLDTLCVQLENYSGLYRPKTIGELVFVRDSMCGWSRGEVLSIGPTDSAQVKLVDTNKLSRVKFADICPVDAKIKQPPVVAVHCVLWNVGGMAPGMSWEKDVLPELDIKVMRAVVKVPGDPCQIELYNEGAEESLNAMFARYGLVTLKVPQHINTTTRDNQTGQSNPPQCTATVKNQVFPGVKTSPVTKTSPHLSTTSPQQQTANTSPAARHMNPKSPNESSYSRHEESGAALGVTNRELSIGFLSGGGGQPQQFRTQRPNVTVCHVEDPGSFFCHWNEESVKKTFEEEELAFREDMMNGIRHHGPPATASLKPGTIVAALSPGNNSWYRAEVLETNFHGTNKVLVRLVDYGPKDLVPANCVRTLPDNHRRLPYQAIHCGFPMWNPETSPNPTAATEITKMRLENNDFDLSLDGFEDGKYRVIDLRAPGMSTSLIRQEGPMQLVLQMKPITPETAMLAAKNTSPVRPAVTVRQSAMPAEFVGEVCHTYSIDNFYVQETEMAELDALQERLNTYCRQTPPTAFNPAQGQICCAKYSVDGQWYRARVMEPDVEGKCHVLFIDFGNSEAVDKGNLRRCTPDLSQLPPKAFHCALHDLTPQSGGWRKCDIKLFVETLVGGPCHFTYRSTVGDVNHVTILHPVHGDLATLLRNKRIGVAPPEEIAVVEDSLKTILENEKLKQQIAAMSAHR